MDRDQEASTSQVPSVQNTNVTSETTPLVPKYIPKGDEGTDSFPVKQTALLISGAMAGSAVLSLPRALTKTGWIGVPIIIGLCAVAAISAKRLVQCWSIVEEIHPELRGSSSTYNTIAEKAIGTNLGKAVSVCTIVTLIGTSVVYLLMAAEIIEESFLYFVPAFGYCIWYLVLVALITPLTLFDTAKNLPLTGLVVFGAAVAACVLYFVQIILDVRRPPYRYGLKGFQPFFFAFGTIMFSFGGISAVPIIQNDVNSRRKFNRSLRYSFLAILALYLPMAISGYAVYGESVAPNIATRVSTTPISVVANVLMTVHLVCVSLILINPVFKEAEALYGVDRDSIGHKTIVRVAIMLILLFIGETIPRFHTIQSFLGASTVALLSFILPSYCYIKLVKRLPSDQQSKWSTSGCWELIIFGVVCGVAATLSAIGAIMNTSRALPCYML